MEKKKKVTKKAVKSSQVFKNINEIKEFIVWAKQEKIARLKVEGVEVEFSPMALVDSSYGDEFTENQTGGEELGATDLNEVDDELLYHSS